MLALKYEFAIQQKRQGSDIATAMTTKPTPLHIIPNVIITNENESESEIPTLEIKEIAEKSPLIDINPDMQRAEFRQNYPRSDRPLCQLCDGMYINFSFYDNGIAFTMQ